MKLSVKLSLMAGFLMLLTVALGLFSLVQMAKMNAGTESINNDWLPSTRYALSISVNTSDYRAVQVQLASSTTADDHTCLGSVNRYCREVGASLNLDTVDSWA